MAVVLQESYYKRLDSKVPVVGTTLGDLWRSSDEKTPVCRPSITWVRPYERFTGLQLYQQARQVAKGLLACGIQRGDTVCCLGVRGSDGVIMFMACSMIGVIISESTCYAPVTKAVADIVGSLTPRGLLVGDAVSGIHLENVLECVLSVMAEGTVSFPPLVMFDRKVESSTELKPDRHWKSLTSIMSRGDEITDEELDSLMAKIDPNEPCYYTMSSGSTGKSKFILVGQALLANSGVRMERCMGRDKTFGCPDMASEEPYCFIPLLFDCDYNIIVLPHLDSRDEMVIVEELLQAIQDYRVEYMYYGQHYLTSLVYRDDLRAKYDLSSLQGLIIAGAPSTYDFKQKVVSIAPQSSMTYGLSEFLFATETCPGSIAKNPTSVGRLSFNVEGKIVNQSGGVLPLGGYGELHLRGFPMFLEYKDESELQSQTVSKDGWLKTGDLACMDGEGYLYLKGRILSSERFKVVDDVVYPSNIENFLRQCPGVNQCAVIGTAALGSRGHELNYVIVRTPGSTLTFDDVKTYSMSKMTMIEWPCRIFFYKELPMTVGTRRKILRSELQNLIEQRVRQNPEDGRAFDADIV